MTTPAPAIGFDEFAAAVLTDWFGEGAKSDQPDRETFTSPMEAAAHVAWLALTQCDGKRGRVHLLAADAGLAREARDFLVAFFETKPLASRVRKVLPDGLALLGGVTIECSANAARRPSDLLHAARLVRGREKEAERRSTRDMMRAVFLAARDPVVGPQIEAVLGVQAGTLNAISARLAEQSIARWDAQRRLLGARPQAPETAVPVVPRMTEEERLAEALLEEERLANAREMRGWVPRLNAVLGYSHTKGGHQ